MVIEGEPCVDDPAINAGAMVRGMIARLQQTSELRTFYRVAAREMRAVTGFDRVMIYRFDHDGSGEVIAESARSGLESYLGLHYPASDIPRQARILYERNWLRIIPDVNAKPAAIEPQLDREGQALDLSMSILRSVSPIHVEYLQNMGVAASMSASILRQGKLWGLFACHHYAPHHVSFARRTAAELFGQMFSLLMESRERDNESASEARAQKLHHQLITVMANEATQFESIVAHLDDLADLLACDGIGVWINDRATLKGLTPDEAQFAKLVAFLADRNISEVFARHDIGAEYPAGRAFADRAAGMMVVPLSRPGPRLPDLLPPGDLPHRELGRRSVEAGHVRPARRPADAAQEFRALAGDGERAIVALAAGRVPHRRSAARQLARSDPAPVRSHGNRAPTRAGTSGTADRGAQPSRPQHSGTDPRRHHPEQGFGD